jgi:hypothetical protein
MYDVPNEYKEELVCDYETSCYSSTGPIQSYMNSNGERQKDTCVFKDCMNREDRITMKKAKEIVSKREGAICALNECK